ncbi:hypothetical protein BASA81_015310 [Batrachochytrium salamandrivorans]|nr:hypothetical protein BASA81_015310 [Batrachochytrium salamandrivorans]
MLRLRGLCNGLPIEVGITALGLFRRASALLPNELECKLAVACVLLASKVQEIPQTISSLLAASSDGSDDVAVKGVGEMEVQRVEMLVVMVLGFDRLIGSREDFDLLGVFVDVANTLQVQPQVQSKAWEYLRQCVWMTARPNLAKSCACLALAARDCQVDLGSAWWLRCLGSEQEIEDAAWELDKLL